MLDIKFIRDHSDIVKQAVKQKFLTVNIDELLRLDSDRLKLLAETEQSRAQQNEANQKFGSALPETDRRQLLTEMGNLKTQLAVKEEHLKKIMMAWRQLMLEVPNIPDVSVPTGKTDNDNQEIKQWGTKPQFDFNPKNHIELMTTASWANLERGTKVAGFRGYFLSGPGATLAMSIWQLAWQTLITEGFTPMLVPSLLKREMFLGTGYLPQGSDDLYRTQDDSYLAGTAEVAAMGYWSDEIMPIEELPKKMVCFSPCFRREAGSHGQDTRGLIRVHEFFKVEQVILCTARHEESVKWHEELLRLSEKILQLLELPYRVVINASGDLGLGQVKKYDLEVWMPSENRYREVNSISYFHDFQSRRLNIRYRDSDGKLQFVHSLNATAAATPRLLAAIVENYQTSDGQIKIPDVLQSYIRK
ncbi:MAG: serine--tRNA ligase [Patescibacteria group bacterium]